MLSIYPSVALNNFRQLSVSLFGIRCLMAESMRLGKHTLHHMTVMIGPYLSYFVGKVESHFCIFLKRQTSIRLILEDLYVLLVIN